MFADCGPEGTEGTSHNTEPWLALFLEGERSVGSRIAPKIRSVCFFSRGLGVTPRIGTHDVAAHLQLKHGVAGHGGTSNIQTNKDSRNTVRRELSSFYVKAGLCLELHLDKAWATPELAGLPHPFRVQGEPIGV